MTPSHLLPEVPINLAEAFEADPQRLERLSGSLAGLYVDFSKTHIDQAIVTTYQQQLHSLDFAGQRAKLFAEDMVNISEQRAATHVAERGSGTGPAVPRAKAAHARMRNFVQHVHRGDYGSIRHILHIGIGGSALGPALLMDALGRQALLEVAVVSNIDGASLEPVLQRFDPRATLILIASKTFTTLETMTNAASAIAWLKAGGLADPLAHCVALTAAAERARAFGIADNHIFDFAATVGGRYSLWSSIGLPVALAIGYDEFDALLAGAAAMDRHFFEAPQEQNLPLLAAIIDVHYATRLGAATRAVFAYDDRLKLLPFYLQQLEMESNGKQVSADGRPLTAPTAAITWGGTGTDAQHAVFQLLHQGTHLVPVEFVAVREPGHRLDPAHHRQLLTNCFAQGAALMRGRSYAEALALTHGDAALAHAKTFPGNRPSITLLLDRLDPATLGALIAFYEHRTFAAAVLHGVNPFDQWGVELGKDIAHGISTGSITDFDVSTTALLARAGI